MHAPQVPHCSPCRGLCDEASCAHLLLLSKTHPLSFSEKRRQWYESCVACAQTNVHEALLFSALLRLGEDVSAEQREVTLFPHAAFPVRGTISGSHKSPYKPQRSIASFSVLPHQANFSMVTWGQSTVD